jgi:hypothetical protein
MSSCKELPRHLMRIALAVALLAGCGGDGGGEILVPETTASVPADSAAPTSAGGTGSQNTSGATTAPAPGAFDSQLAKLVGGLVLPDGVPEAYRYPGATVVDVGTTKLFLLPTGLNYHAVMCSADAIDRVRAFYEAKTAGNRINVGAGRSFTCPNQAEISLTLSAQASGMHNTIARAKQTHAANMPPALLVPTDDELLVGGTRGKQSGAGQGEKIRFDASYFAKDASANAVTTIAAIATAMKAAGLGGKLGAYEGKSSLSYQSGGTLVNVSASVQPNSATKKDGLLLTYIITAPAR